jgi:uncharacterized protein (TIRG00374 family)
MIAMSEEKSVARRWKEALNAVTVAALLLLVYAIRHQLVDTFKNLAHVHAWALLLMIPIELINYHAQTKLYQRLFAMVGSKLSYSYLYKMSLELNFVNHVFPSGGVTGISYFGMRLRHDGTVTAGRATLIQVMKLAMTFLSFEVLIIFGLISLAIVGRANNITILVASWLSAALLFGTIGFAYLVGSQQRINSFFTALTRALNRIIHFVVPGNPEAINVDRARQLFDDFHDNYQQIRNNHLQLKAPFWYALLANVTEVAALYVVYIAFGHTVNIGAVILAYAVANFAGLVSVLPGGVGVYEALMTAVLVSAGVPAAISLPVTVMYRVVNTAIQLPPGYYLYHRNLTRQDRVKLREGI